MTSQIIQCEGIVLRNLRYGETSRVATLLTREIGKVGVIAKGARDPKSQFGASLELYNKSEYVLYFRPGRDLQFLKTGFLEREHRGLLKDSRRFLWAAALAEFLDRVLLEETTADGLFDLVLRGFRVLETEPTDSLRELFRGLQLRIATYLGYSPGLNCCGRCKRPAIVSVNTVSSGRMAQWIFIPSEGGVVCPTCSAGEPGGIALGDRELRRLRRMAVGALRRETTAPGENVSEPSNGWYRSPGWCRDLDRLVDEFLRFHIDVYRGLRVLEASAIRDCPQQIDRETGE